MLEDSCLFRSWAFHLRQGVRTYLVDGFSSELGHCHVLGTADTPRILLAV